MGIVEIGIGVAVIAGVGYLVYTKTQEEKTTGTGGGTGGTGETAPTQPAAAKPEIQKIADEPDEVVHDWTVEEFDAWWNSLTEKQINDTLESGATFPKGKKFPNVEDYRYWNRLAIKRATKHIYEGVTPPKENGMAPDGGAKR